MVRSLVAAVAIVIVIVIASASCASVPHTSLPRAPVSSAPYDTRAAYFKAYALDSRDGGALFLHDGTRIMWPEDLLPAVDDSSPTAMAVRDSVAARGRVEQYAWLANTGGATTLVGLAALTFSWVPVLLPISDKDQSTDALALAGSGAVLALAGLGLIGIDVAIVGADSDTVYEAADRAARTYPQALSDRLGVGVDADGRIVDHGGMPSVAAPPKAQPL